MPQLGLVRWLLSLILVAFISSLSGTVFAGSWEGYEQRDFTVSDRPAFVIVPKSPAAGHPWIWRTEFFGHEPQADLMLLSKGFHVAYIDLQNMYGAPVAMRHMDAMYDYVTREFRLSPKTVLEGFSRGGLFTLNWGARNPEKVACIYNDAPVCDFRSWPGGKGRAKGSPDDWERLKNLYRLTDEESLLSKWNPMNNLAPLASAKVPILHVCGEADDLVPIEENSRLLEQHYRQLNGPFVLIAKPNCNHHPHSLKDPVRIVNFVLSHTGLADQVSDVATPYGEDYFALRGGLNHCQLKFARDKVGRVAFLGGSITATNGWRDLVCQDLQTRFPETKFAFINAGIPSLGSTPGAFRLTRDVLSHGPVDLLFEEAAVNDDTNGFSDVEQVRGMEGIVRHALLSNPLMDVVLLHFVDPGKIEQINKGQIPNVIVNHERVAEHYQIPSINLAREVTERIHAGEFSWDKDFKDLHPSPFGHALYAKTVRRLFDAAWHDGKVLAENASPRGLLEPLDPCSYFRGQLISPATAVEANSLTLGTGWQLISNWQPADQAGTRPGFVNVPVLACETAGAQFKLKFQGTAIGLFVAAGPDTGTVDFRIDDGPWQTEDFFTQWSPQLHLPWAKMLASDLRAGDHDLEVRVSVISDARSKGHAIRIAYLLVN